MNVLVVDGHAIYRQGLAAALAAAPEIGGVREAASVAEATEVGAIDCVDVMLIDIDLPGAEPLLRGLRGRSPVKALVCSRSDEAGRIMAAIEAGALGYLAKDTLTPDTLVAAVRSVFAGSGVLAPDLLADILGRISEASRTVLEPRGLRLSRLTAREQEVLRLLADGHATREVARQMSYSERTVKNVLHDVVTKLNVRTRSQAVAFAIREGLI